VVSAYYRADVGLTIVMKHTGINCGEPEMATDKTETDTERQARTGLSSLEITDRESAAVQVTRHRVTLESMVEKILSEEYIHPVNIPHMTICVITVDNGFALVGKSAPADAENFDETLGRKFAKEDAIRQMWPLEAYLLRERMML
jgi:phosphohistidine phosphatase SixA